MHRLPLLLDDEEALDFFHSQARPSDPIKAHVIRVLAKEGYKNRHIREALGINKVYTVTHLLRVGIALSDDEMELWHKNPGRITLGHLRAIIKLKRNTREALIRKLLVSRTPVHQLEALAKGQNQKQDIDIEKFARTMSEVTGRPTSVRFSKRKKTGTLTLSFYNLDDLDDLCEKLGYRPQDEF